MQDLGTLPGEDFNIAADVNASGTVVGVADLLNSPRGFVWTASTGMQDLNTLVPPEWNIWSASSINDRGEIVGTGVSRRLGGPHAVLLTPVN
jgi:probable HAF family extracellular repeat protein